MCCALLSGWKGNHLLKLKIGKFRWWTTPISSCTSQKEPWTRQTPTANRTLPPSPPAIYFLRSKGISLSNEQVCWETITSSGTCCKRKLSWQIQVPGRGGGRYQFVKLQLFFFYSYSEWWLRFRKFSEASSSSKRMETSGLIQNSVKYEITTLNDYRTLGGYDFAKFIHTSCILLWCIYKAFINIYHALYLVKLINIV